MVKTGVLQSTIWVVLLTLFLGAESVGMAARDEPETDALERRITVEDVVRETVIGDPFSLTWNDVNRSEHVSTASPDGQHVAVVLRRGDLKRRTNHGVLLVYRTAELLQGPHPETVAALDSASNHQPIAFVQWLADNETIVFGGTRGEQLSQVYSVNVRTHKLRLLTHEKTQLLQYRITPDGNRLVAFSELPSVRPERDPVCRQRGCLVTARGLANLQQGIPDGSPLMAVYDRRSGQRRLFGAPEEGRGDIAFCNGDFTGDLSPDGRFVLRLCTYRPSRWPAWWAEYTTDPELRSDLGKHDGAGLVYQLIVVDLERNTQTNLTDAPYLRTQPAPIWIDGGRRLILAGTLESLSGVTGDERNRRRADAAIEVIDPLTRRTERVATLDPKFPHVSKVQWDENTHTLAVEASDSSGTAYTMMKFEREGEQWIAARQDRTLNNDRRRGVELAVEQSLNDPPVLVASDPKTGAKNRVLDPNPWLAQLTLGRVEAITWTTNGSRKWRGGLYYPPDYKTGVRYPLVLQTHGFDTDKFALTGIARNFVAQPLAAQGMFVLQVAEHDEKGHYPLREWPTVQAAYEGAIDRLDDLGLIDRAKVGIQGWSWTGVTVGYTLTHSSYPFAAAALTSSGDFGWWWYMLQGAPRTVEDEWGAAPFGEGLETWLKMSATFNLERVYTPMFMWGDGPLSLWDWYAGLRRLGKPVEFWLLSDSVHNVFKVGERLQTGQLLVDWFRFWLKGEEDPDPDKAQQYSRWREFRLHQEVMLKQRRPPLLNWTATPAATGER